MTCSIEPRGMKYVKGYGFLSLARKMGKRLSNKYRQKLLDTAKQSTTAAIKTAYKKQLKKHQKQQVI